MIKVVYIRKGIISRELGDRGGLRGEGGREIGHTARREDKKVL